MTKFIIEQYTGTPYCTNCGAIFPDCGPNAINIDPTQVHYCYHCGEEIEEFIYPEEEN